jgi:hypothetical protein
LKAFDLGRQEWRQGIDLLQVEVACGIGQQHRLECGWGLIRGFDAGKGSPHRGFVAASAFERKRAGENQGD